MRFFEARGYQVLARNVRRADGELDLILIDPKGSIAFVEVRHRRTEATGSALESLTPAKLARLGRAAGVWLGQHPEFQDRHCRFDVLAIDGDLARPRLTWLCDAFGA